MASRGPVPGMGQVMVLSKYSSGSYVSRTCVMMFLRTVLHSIDKRYLNNRYS